MTRRQARIESQLQEYSRDRETHERIIAFWGYQEGVPTPWTVRMMDVGLGTFEYMTTKQVELLLIGISAGKAAVEMAAHRQGGRQ